MNLRQHHARALHRLPIRRQDRPFDRIAGIELKLERIFQFFERCVMATYSITRRAYQELQVMDVLLDEFRGQRELSEGIGGCFAKTNRRPAPEIPDQFAQPDFRCDFRTGDRLAVRIDNATGCRV